MRTETDTPNAEAGTTPAERRIVIARDLGELWLAVLEDGRVAELVVRPEDGGRWLGTIAKGRVTRLAPGVRAAFVDVGLARDAFTALPPGAIAERRLVPGAEVLVQVTREAQGGKGHRATFDITLPGWALVYAPEAQYRGVSKRIEDPAERDRLRALLDELAPPSGGLIARTAAAGMSREELLLDRDALLARWAAIRARADASRAPSIVHREENVALAFVRDHLAFGAGAGASAHADGITEVVGDASDEAELGALLGALQAETAPRFRVHPGPLPATEAWGLEAALAGALSAVAPLPGGGCLVIQPTEALVSIDVNSGTDTSAEDLEETALRTNLEAAVEVARQVRLRELGGLVVVDFIDMAEAAHRARVNDRLHAAFAADRLKSRILPLSEFCLAQITRQRRRPALEKIFREPCSCCGRGLVMRPEAEARRLLREARRGMRPFPAGRARIEAPPAVVEAGREIAEQWGAASGVEPGRLTWAERDDAIAVEILHR